MKSSLLLIIMELLVEVNEVITDRLKLIASTFILAVITRSRRTEGWLAVLISFGLGVVLRNVSAFIILEKFALLLLVAVELGSILVVRTELFKLIRDPCGVFVILLWL
jgi:hypothetical protein